MFVKKDAEAVDYEALRGPIQLPVHIGIPEDSLHVFPSFGEWN